jgi:hypothetical protein
MKTRCSGSRSSWPQSQACRQLRTSGRHCSSACADFFERDPTTNEEQPQAFNAGRYPPFTKGCLDLGQGDVTPLLDKTKDQVGVAFDPPRAAVTAQRAWSNVALCQDP